MSTEIQPGQIVTVPASSLKFGVIQPMPDLDQAELAALEADFASGVRDPVDVCDGGVIAQEFAGQRVVVDGNTRARWAARNDKDVQIRYADLSNDEDAHAYAIRVNSNRRHLTAVQRREVIARALERYDGYSSLFIARICGVSDKTVTKVRESRDRRSEYSEPASNLHTDSAGRRQPAHKPARPRKPSKDEQIKTLAAERDEARAALEGQRAFAELAQRDSALPPDLEVPAPVTAPTHAPPALDTDLHSEVERLRGELAQAREQVAVIDRKAREYGQDWQRAHAGWVQRVAALQAERDALRQQIETLKGELARLRAGLPPLPRPGQRQSPPAPSRYGTGSASSPR